MLQKQEIAEEKEDPEFSGDDFKIRRDVHWAYFASLSVMLICLACGLFGRHFINYSAAVTGYPFTRYGSFLSQLGMFVQFFVSELNVMKRQGHDDTYNEIVNYDQLTGLYTPYYLTDKISKERAEDPSLMLAVIYVNLAKFKLYNVINGHEKGDECLKQVADILKSVFGEESLACFGNDHFVIFDFDDKNSIAKVEKANQLVAQIDLSFNLSRTDFVTSDPNQILLDLVKKYDIPREMLRVEITEPIFHERKVLFEAGSLSYQLSFQMIVNIEGKCLLKVLGLSSQRSNSQVDNNEFDNRPLDVLRTSRARSERLYTLANENRSGSWMDQGQEPAWPRSCQNIWKSCGRERTSC